MTSRDTVLKLCDQGTALEPRSSWTCVPQGLQLLVSHLIALSKNVAHTRRLQELLPIPHPLKKATSRTLKVCSRAQDVMQLPSITIGPLLLSCAGKKLFVIMHLVIVNDGFGRG